MSSAKILPKIPQNFSTITVSFTARNAFRISFKMHIFFWNFYTTMSLARFPRMVSARVSLKFPLECISVHAFLQHFSRDPFRDCFAISSANFSWGIFTSFLKKSKKIHYQTGSQLLRGLFRNFLQGCLYFLIWFFKRFSSRMSEFPPGVFLRCFSRSSCKNFLSNSLSKFSEDFFRNSSKRNPLKYFSQRFEHSFGDLSIRDTFRICFSKDSINNSCRIFLNPFLSIFQGSCQGNFVQFNSLYFRDFQPWAGSSLLLQRIYFQEHH